MSGLQSDLRSGVLILQKQDPFMQRLVRCTLVKWAQSSWLAIYGGKGQSSMTASIKRVHVVFKTHLDIGFTDLGKNVIERYMEHFIPRPWSCPSSWLTKRECKIRMDNRLVVNP